MQTSHLFEQGAMMSYLNNVMMLNTLYSEAEQKYRQSHHDRWGKLATPNGAIHKANYVLCTPVLWQALLQIQQSGYDLKRVDAKLSLSTKNPKGIYLQFLYLWLQQCQWI
jgi:hypothetical protein